MKNKKCLYKEREIVDLSVLFIIAALFCNYLIISGDKVAL